MKPSMYVSADTQPSVGSSTSAAVIEYRRLDDSESSFAADSAKTTTDDTLRNTNVDRGTPFDAPSFAVAISTHHLSTWWPRPRTTGSRRRRAGRRRRAQKNRGPRPPAVLQANWRLGCREEAGSARRLVSCPNRPLLEPCSRSPVPFSQF